MTRSSVDVRDEVPVFDCEQTVRRLWDYLDGELAAVDLAGVDAHLAACSKCPPHFEFERRFLAVVRDVRFTVSAPESDTIGALRARVVSMLSDAGELRHSGAPE